MNSIDVEKLVDCEVRVPPDLKVGRYANAFRVIPEGDEYLLDFLKYSPAEHKAEVIARIRVPSGLLTSMYGRVGQAIETLKRLQTFL